MPDKKRMPEGVVEIPLSMVPKGFEVTREYRIPRMVGSNADGSIFEPWLEGDNVSTKSTNIARIILRRVRAGRIIFTPQPTPRIGRRGEWILDACGDPLRLSETTASPVTILIKSEEL